MSHIILYTDGSCLGNPGPGGYAALLQQVDEAGQVLHEMALVGGRPAVTNNQMELRAAITGLLALKGRQPVRLHSDSQYVLDLLTGRTQARANRELVACLQHLAAQHAVTAHKVAAHSGVAANERVDHLAREQATVMQTVLGYQQRVIVAGSRTFDDYDRLCRTLDRLLSRLAVRGRLAIVSGGARGADRLGERYAEARDYPVLPLPAEWAIFGKGAGYRRNEEVLAVATHVVVFWQNQSPGSKHLIERARQAGLPLRVIHD